MHTSNRPTCSVNPSAAFTLIELLTCVSVIGLLAGLLIPSMTRARQAAQSIPCRSHLRQWGLATHLYATDHADLLPYDGAPNGISRSRAWYVDLPPLVGVAPYPLQGPWRTNPEVSLPRSLFLCPSNSRRSNGHLLFHYCLNRNVNGTGPNSRRARLTDFPSPDRVVWLFDNGQRAAVASIRNAHTNLHSSGSHFLFLDGHVSHFPAHAYWDFSRRLPRLDHPSLDWRLGDPP